MDKDMYLTCEKVTIILVDLFQNFFLKKCMFLFLLNLAWFMRASLEIRCSAESTRSAHARA